MRLAAIVAEFDPFHKGHAALVQAVRAAGATHVAAVMSGSFVQRGAAACLSKTARVRQALSCGVDLVAELPLPWAVSGAETFAAGGVALAGALGADVLAFGSECGDAAALHRVAELLLKPCTGELLRAYMKTGLPFAAARERAVAELAGASVAALLRQPNNILGIEYCKALLCQQLPAECFTLQRVGAAHNSQEDNSCPAASRVRTLLAAGNPAWQTALPPASAAVLQQELSAGRAPAQLSCLERTLLYRLRTMTAEELACLPDVREGMEHRLYAAARRETSLKGLYAAAKSKRYTHARLRRIALAALLGLRKQDSAGLPPYLRVLGFTAGAGGEVLAQAAQGGLPLVTHTADRKKLDKTGRKVIELESKAMDVWALCCPLPCPAGLDQTAGILVL